jgi:hypothetical protein
MVPGIRIVYSQRTRHDSNIPELLIKVNRRLDPYSYLLKIIYGTRRRLSFRLRFGELRRDKMARQAVHGE